MDASFPRFQFLLGSLDREVWSPLGVPCPRPVTETQHGQSHGFGSVDTAAYRLAALLHVIRVVVLYKPRASPPQSPHQQSGAHSGIDFLGQPLGG